MCSDTREGDACTEAQMARTRVGGSTDIVGRGMRDAAFAGIQYSALGKARLHVGSPAIAKVLEVAPASRR